MEGPCVGVLRWFGVLRLFWSCLVSSDTQIRVDDLVQDPCLYSLILKPLLSGSIFCIRKTATVREMMFALLEFDADQVGT